MSGIDLTPHFDRFIAQQVASGRFADASEVVRAGLRLLERQDREDAQRLELLRSLAAEGLRELDAGRGKVFEGEAQLGEWLRRLDAQSAELGPVSAHE